MACLLLPLGRTALQGSSSSSSSSSSSGRRMHDAVDRKHDAAADGGEH
jgi:hypothetical protein